MQLRRIGDMLSAFGFVRFSCSLLIHCFITPKRRRRRSIANRRRGSDAEDINAVSLPRSAIAVAKSAVAKATRVRPLRPVGKTGIASLLGFFLKKKPLRQPIPHSLDQDGAITDMRHRRTVFQEGVVCTGMEREIPGPGVHVDSLDSLSSAYYPSDSDTDGESFVFGDLSPRTSSECFSTSRGLNPTFYGMEMSEEEDVCPWQRSEMRHIDSVVEKDARLKENAHSPGHQQLLLNPAYGELSREESDNGEVQTETKLKSLKSVAKAGVLALPTSTALVDTAFIGRTSLNPTYGDVTSDTDTDDETLSDTSWAPEAQNDVGLATERVCQIESSPRSLLSFRGMADNGFGENMGTLTWKNVIFSASDKSDSEQDSNTGDVSDLQIQWKPSPLVDSEDALSEASNPRPSPFLNASLCLEDVHFRFNKNTTGAAKGEITKTLVTPICHDVFEDIEFKCPPLPYLHPPQDAKISRATSSPKGCSNFLTAGLKQTRWALRWFSLLLGRVDVFASDKKK